MCKAGPALVKFVDASPDLSASALSRQAGSLGIDLTTDRISTHRKHREAERPVGEGIAKQKRDFAVLVQEKAVQQLESGELDLMDKNAVPGINAGLKAQAIIDKRELGVKKHAASEMLVALLSALRGESPVRELEPPTIEGQYIDVTPDAE